MEYQNEMTLKFVSKSINESFARSAVAAFCVQLNPTLDEITDIKTAVSEAVTNCVVHAYPDKIGEIEVWVGVLKNEIFIRVCDWGVGIVDVNLAREPFFSTRKSEERAGMGFTVMESFMDDVVVESRCGKGVSVFMKKSLRLKSQAKIGV